MEPEHIDTEHATLLLQRVAQGDRAAQEELLPLVFAQLHQLAERALRGQEQHTLQPTALVNEAYLRVLGANKRDFESRSHFLGIAAKAMTVGIEGRSTGEAILRAAKSAGADLLIKGAYTQSRFRQMIFGGATSHILANAELPVLMAH